MACSHNLVDPGSGDNSCQDDEGGTHSRFDIYSFPDSLWRQVLLRCDKTTIVSASKSCKLFNNICSQQFWFAKCDFDGVGLPPLEWRQFIKNQQSRKGSEVTHQFDYKKLCFGNPFNRNVCYKLDKDSTVERLVETEGSRIHLGRKGLRIETELSDPLLPPTRDDVEACFVTSSDWSGRYYEIDLEEIGIDLWIMDKIRPTITIRELHACRRDCGAIYMFSSHLIGENYDIDPHNVRLGYKFYKKEWEQYRGGQPWETVEHVFTEYPVGVRKIGVTSFGRDTQWLAGHYGLRFTNTEVIISFPEEVRFKIEHEFTVYRLPNSE